MKREDGGEGCVTPVKKGSTPPKPVHPVKEPEKKPMTPKKWEMENLLQLPGSISGLPHPEH